LKRNVNDLKKYINPGKVIFVSFQYSDRVHIFLLDTGFIKSFQCHLYEVPTGTERRELRGRAKNILINELTEQLHFQIGTHYPSR